MPVRSFAAGALPFAFAAAAWCPQAVAFFPPPPAADGRVSVLPTGGAPIGSRDPTPPLPPPPFHPHRAPGVEHHCHCPPPPVCETPEPATLTGGLVGLGVVAAVRRRSGKPAG